MLEIISAISLASCLCITWFSSTKDESHGGQSVKDSMIEAWWNILIGFSINYTANLLILPLVPSLGNSHIDPWENFMMGWIYTAISMVRSFFIRRWQNKKTIKKLKEQRS